MKLLAILTLAAASTVAAKGHNKDANSTTNAVSTKSQCKQVAKLTHLMDVAANSTKLDEVTKGNATRAAKIQSKASSAAATLQTMQANATLMTACDAIFAVQADERACGQMASLEKLMAVVANQTMLDKKTKGNATKADALKAKASAGATELSTMQGNATLTTLCAGLETKDTCKSMSKLQKEVDMAANQTALDAKFEGNATKISAFQAKASKAATKLASMQSNSTLMDACATLTSQSNSQAAASGSAGASSDATAVRAVGTTMSLVALFAAGLMVL